MNRSPFSWCFVRLHCLIYKVHFPPALSGRAFRITHLFPIVKRFFSLFFRFSACYPPSSRDSFVNIPPFSPLCQAIFSLFYHLFFAASSHTLSRPFYHLSHTISCPVPFLYNIRWQTARAKAFSFF